MNSTHKLPNIAEKLENRLSSVGISDIKYLRDIGSKDAFLRLYIKEGDTCLCTLYALEGAVQGIRWHMLSEDKKQELRAFYKSIK